MGFTIDMGSGEVLDETPAQIPEKLKSTECWNEMPVIDYVEQLESETDAPLDSHKLPESIARIDVDTFLDKFC